MLDIKATSPAPCAKGRDRVVKRLCVALAGLCLGLCSGCANLGYYWQSVSGHMQMLHSARPVQDWLGDTQTPAALKARLALSQRMRRFAVTQLRLPDNGSYQRYADLQRSAVVWNVMAAPELSLTLQTWCFPVAGCVGYRGYFSEAEARNQARQLEVQGLEVYVYGVPAYSTLGLMNWAGGDPLLNTFINYPEGELARLIFHELAHQVVYAGDDTSFNESFATAVERLGSQRWLHEQAGEAARRDYAAFDKRRQEFRALVRATRRELRQIYKQNKAITPATQAQTAITLVAKREAMQRFRDDYARLKAAWGGFAGYDPWVASANNAFLGAQAAYDELVPGFEALFEREGRDWHRFYDAVRHLASLSKKDRRQALQTNPMEPDDG